MTDQWIKWQPNIPVQLKYFMKKVVDDEGGLYVLVDEKGDSMASDWIFFLVEKSSYFDLIKNSSKGVYLDYDLIHFAVISGESLLEVITDMLPHFIEGW